MRIPITSILLALVFASPINAQEVGCQEVQEQKQILRAVIKMMENGNSQLLFVSNRTVSVSAIFAGTSNPQRPNIVSEDLFVKLLKAPVGKPLAHLSKITGITSNVRAVDFPPNGPTDKNFWPRFQKANPGISRYYAFSQAAVNKDCSQAAILAASYCPVLCGAFGGILTLKRMEGEWKPDSFERVWVN